MLKGKDKRDQKERGGKSRGRRPGLRLCHSGGIWPDDGFTAFKCVRYTSINSSRLHRSHTCNSQHANYREEADSDSCWKLPNFQKGGGGTRNLSAQATTTVPGPMLGERSGLFPRKAGREATKRMGTKGRGGGTWLWGSFLGLGLPQHLPICAGRAAVSLSANPNNWR